MKYSVLFTISVLHDYFTESVSDAVRIVPTPETQQQLNGYGMLTKFFENKLYVLVKHTEISRPYKDLQNDFKLQFYMEVTSSNFDLITNNPSKDPYNDKLLLSNTASILDGNSKAVAGKQYLNEKLALFNAAQEYRYNDLVRNGADTAFECLQKVDSGTGDLTNDEQFRTLSAISYIGPNTLATVCGSIKTISLDAPSAALNVDYHRYNYQTNLYDISEKITVIGPAENPSGTVYDSFTLNFLDQEQQLLNEGHYRVTINGQEVFLYFRPQNDLKRYLGLINLHNDSNVTNDDYRFLQPDGSFYLQAPDNVQVATRDYQIHFAPAQYLLKYIGSSASLTAVTDELNVIDFQALPNHIFQSRFPVRISERALSSITVTYAGNEFKKTKIPGINRLTRTEDENQYIVSETYLNL